MQQRVVTVELLIPVEFHDPGSPADLHLEECAWPPAAVLPKPLGVFHSRGVALLVVAVELSQCFERLLIGEIAILFAGDGIQRVDDLLDFLVV